MKTRPFLSTLFCIALVACCLGCSDDEVPISDEQEILFEVNYVNYAWGYQNNGILIDKQGRIRTYDKPKDWKFAALGPLTVAEMDENLSKTTISKVTIPPAELAQYVNLLKKVSDDDFSNPVNRGADMGGSSFYIYHFDPGSKVYTTVLLQSTGDMDTFNLDPDAKKISEWLLKVIQEVK
jgi:hypothetical protein